MLYQDTAGTYCNSLAMKNLEPKTNYPLPPRTCYDNNLSQNSVQVINSKNTIITISNMSFYQQRFFSQRQLKSKKHHYTYLYTARQVGKCMLYYVQYYAMNFFKLVILMICKIHRSCQPVSSRIPEEFVSGNWTNKPFECFIRQLCNIR